jgi:hypothetical protein
MIRCRALLSVAGTIALLAGPAAAQQPAGEPAALVGTVFDPAGKPAEDLLLTLTGRESDVSLRVRTDADGKYRFPPVSPGQYLLRTPATDLITPSSVELARGENVVDARLAVDDTAVLIRVCRECKPADYRLPDRIKGDFTNQRDEQSAAIVARAEPEEGWDAFNERPFSYPPGMKNSKLEGVVEIEGTIATDGSAINLNIVDAPDPRLREIALSLARDQRWRPARIRATPVEVPLRVTVEFSIYGD